MLAPLVYANENEVILDVSGLLPEGGEPQTVICGDVNGDGRVNASDNEYLAHYLARWTGYDTLPYKK